MNLKMNKCLNILSFSKKMFTKSRIKLIKSTSIWKILLKEKFWWMKILLKRKLKKFIILFKIFKIPLLKVKDNL